PSGMCEGVAIDGFAGGVNIDQLRGHRQHRLSGALLDPIPRTTAKPVEFGLVAIATDVALNKVDTLDWNIHGVIAGVFKVDEIALDIGASHVLEAAVFPDTVLDMHYEIVRLNFLEIEQRSLGSMPNTAAGAWLAEQLVFAINVDSVHFEDSAG